MISRKIFLLKIVLKLLTIVCKLQMIKSGRPETFALSPYYKYMMMKLLVASNRFRYALQSACQLLACTPEDCYPCMIEHTEMVFLFLREVSSS